MISCFPSFPDSEAPNQPIVKSSEHGRYYAKSVPDEHYGQKGKTQVFSVGKDSDTLICEYDWYAREIYMGGAGDATLVRFGPWHRGHEPKDTDLAIGFYRDGKMVREYTTPELVKLGSGISQSVSHYQVFHRRLGFRWLKENDYAFEVEGVNKQTFIFDTNTGAVISSSAKPSAKDESEKKKTSSSSPKI
jgi:hypothetical protein